jgi:hypothetical protein
MHEWLRVSFSSPCSQPTMAYYELNFTVSSPGESAAFMEFSPNGRFLAVGDQDSSSLYLLDRLAGFHPTIASVTPAQPTALVWETSKAFYVGLSDGWFVHYRVDPGGKKLVEGAMNSLFYGKFPTTAIALDAESRTLVLSVGPDVFAFRRIRASTFYPPTNQSSRLTLLKVNSASLPTFRAASASKESPEVQPPRFQDLFVLPSTTRLSSPFAVRI